MHHLCSRLHLLGACGIIKGEDGVLDNGDGALRVGAQQHMLSIVAGAGQAIPHTEQQCGSKD